jgi:AcrR family transcriptional regulator
MNESDRRTRRTRELLIHALLELIDTRHYDQISVQDIVERADVGRSTFYAHYENKDALLMGGFEHLLEMLVQQIQCESTGQLTFETTMLFQHARGHYEIYRTLLWGTGFELLIKDGHTALSEKIETRLRELRGAPDESLVPLPVLACSLAGSLLVLLKWWLDNKMPYPPERMNEMFQQLAMTGIQSGKQLPGA